MGYTHYYSVKPKFDADQFAKVVKDFKQMIPVLEHLGVKLAGGHGEDQPKIDDVQIWFNGLTKCGHTERDLGITWPAKKATGISKNGVGMQLSEIVKGSWFAGASLETRACGGDCSHETFSLECEMRDIPEYKMDPERLKENGGLMFEFCKTAYKPYDLAVNVCLIIAKHHLRNDIKVNSDGETENWIEGMQLCQHFLGYGLEFKLEDD